jgi:hypothetical protein
MRKRTSNGTKKSLKMPKRRFPSSTEISDVNNLRRNRDGFQIRAILKRRLLNSRKPRIRFESHNRKIPTGGETALGEHLNRRADANGPEIVPQRKRGFPDSRKARALLESNSPTALAASNKQGRERSVEHLMECRSGLGRQRARPEESRGKLKCESAKSDDARDAHPAARRREPARSRKQWYDRKWSLEPLEVSKALGRFGCASESAPPWQT